MNTPNTLSTTRRENAKTGDAAALAAFAASSMGTAIREAFDAGYSAGRASALPRDPERGTDAANIQDTPTFLRTLAADGQLNLSDAVRHKLVAVADAVEEVSFDMAPGSTSSIHVKTTP